MALKKVPMYIKNVAKSVKYSGQDFLNNSMPETMDFISTNSDVFRAVTTDLRNYKTIYKQAKVWWNSSSVKDTINEAAGNVIKDLKTGNFYNKDRENAQMFKDSGWEDVLGGFEDDITNAINDYNSSNSINAQNNTTRSVMDNTEATVGIMSAVGKAVTETTADAASFIVRGQNEIATKNMVNNYKMIGEITTLLSDISTNVRNISEYTNKMGEYFNSNNSSNADLNNKLDQLIALNTELTEMERNKYKAYNDNKEQEIDPLDNVNFTRGSFDIKSYFGTVASRVKKEYENSMIGSMQGMMQGVDPIKLLASNPLKFVSESIMNKMVSKELRKSMEEVDQTVNGFFKSSLLKGSTMLRNKADSSGSDIFNKIADIFGIKKSNPGNMRTDMYVKEAVPWNGIADRALTEVLPTYLRKMLSIMSGQEEMIYDYKSGKFSKITDVKKALKNAEDLSYSGVSSMEDEIGNAIKNAFTMSNSLQETFDNDLKDFFKTIVDNQVFYNPNKASYDDLKNLGLYFRNGQESFDMINAAFQSMDRQKWNKFNTNVINAGEQRRNDINELSKTGVQSGFTGVRNGFDMSFDETDGTNKLASTFGLNKVDKYKKDVFDYLRDIRRVLLEGIRVFPVTIGPATNVSMEGGSIEGRMNFYKDNEPAHTPSILNVSDYNESKEDLMNRAKKSNGEVLDNLYNLNLSKTGMAEYIKRKSNERSGRIAAEEEEKRRMQPDNVITKSKGFISSLYDTGKEVASAPGKIAKNILDSVNDNLLFFLYGSRDGKEKDSIFDTLIKRINLFGDKIVNTVDTKVINPMNRLLFDNDNGIITKINTKISNITEKTRNKLFDEKNGIFTKIQNSFNEIIHGNDKHNGIGYYFKGASLDIANGFMNVVSGKEYISILTGKKHEAREETIFSIFKDGFNTLKESSNKAFESFSKSNIGSNFKEIIGNKINSVTAKASHVLFGTMDEEMKPTEFFQREISPRLPRSVLGAVTGLGLSLFTPLGLVGGLAIGGTTGFLSHFDKFKNILFGEEGSEKRFKADQALSSINNALPRMGVGAISGAALSLITPFGLVGGTLLGGTMGYLSQSEKFKDFLFGNGTDKKGIIDKAYYDKFKSYLPGGVAGAGLGVLGSFFLPGGPVGGAVLGLTMGIAGQSNMIKTYLFGDQDPNSGKRSGGLFGKFKLFMQTEIVMPLKTFAKEVGSKGMYFIRKDLINPILDSLAPIKKEMSLIKDKIIEKVGNIKDAIVDKTEELILRPLSIAAHKNIIDPMKNFFSKIFNGIGNVFKSIISAPSKIINGYAMGLMKKHEKNGDADYKEEWLKNKRARDLKTNKKYQEEQQTVLFEKDRNKLVNNLMRKGRYDANDPNTQRAMAWMNMNGYKYTENISNKVTESTSILDRISKAFSEFKSRWDSRNNFKSNSNKQNDENTDSRADKQRNRMFNNKERNKERDINNPIFNMKGQNTDSRSERQRNRILNNKERNDDKNKKSSNIFNMPGDITNNNNNKSNEPDFIILNNSSKNKYKHDPYNDSDNGMNINLKSIKAGISKIADNVDGQINGVGYHTELIANILIDKFGLPSIMPKGGKMFSHKIKGVFDTLFSVFKKPKEFLGKVIDVVSSPFKKAYGFVLSIPKQIAKMTGSIVKTTAGAIKTVAGGIFKLIPQILDGINTIGKTVGSVVVSVFKTLPYIVKTLGSAFTQLTKVIGTGMVEGVKLLGTGLREATKLTGEFAVGLAKTAKVVLPAFAEGLIETTKVIGKGILGALKGSFGLGKKILKGVLGKNASNDNMSRVIDINNVKNVTLVDTVRMVEKIGDARLFESLGNIVTAVYSLRTGTDDEPLKHYSKFDDTENITDHSLRIKNKDAKVKGTVIDITDRINKKKDKEKRERNSNIVSGKDANSNLPSLGTVVENENLSNTGNKQVDAFKNRELGQVVSKNTKIRNALSLASDKANISVGNILGKVFKKGGILSTIGNLAMLLLPKVLSFFTNIKSKVLKIGKDLLDYLLRKFKLPNLTPNLGGTNTGKKVAEEVAEHTAEKGMAEVAEHGMVNLLGRGSVNTTEKMASKGIITAGENIIEKSGSKLLLNGTTDVIENGTVKAAGKYSTSNIIKGASYEVLDETGGRIAKSGIKESVTRFTQKAAGAVVGDSSLITKILNSSAVKKLAGSKIASVLGKLGTFVMSRMKNAGKAIFTKLAAKWGTIIGTGAVSGGLIPALWYGGNILYGLTETKKIFGLAQNDKPTELMRSIAGFSAFVSDAVTFGLIPTSTIAQFIAGFLLDDKEVQHIKSSQEQLNNEYLQYKQDTGNSELSFDDYNTKVNGGIMSKTGLAIKNGVKSIWDGTKWVGSEIANGGKWAYEKTKEGVKFAGKTVKDFALNKTPLSVLNNDKIRSTFGLQEGDKITLGDRISQGLGSLTSNLTGGLVNDKWAANGVKWMGNNVVNTAKWAKDGIVNGASNIYNKGKDFVMNNTLASAFNNDKIRNTFGLKDGQDIQIKDRISQGIGSTVSSITGGLIDSEGVSKAARGAMIKGEELWNNVTDAIGDKIKEAKEAMGKLNSNLGSMLGFQDEDGNPLSLTAGVGYKFNKIKESAAGAWNYAGSLWDSFETGVGEKMNQAGEALSKFNSNLGSLFGFQDDDGNSLDLSQGISYTIDHLGEESWKLAKGIWGSISEGFKNFKEWVGSGLESMDKDIGKFFGFKDDDGNSLSLSEKVTSSAANFKTKVNNIFNNFTSGLQETSNNYNGGSGDEDNNTRYNEKGGMGIANNGVYYSQNQGPWANKDFGYNKTIGQAGCGPTAAAMMISSVTGKNVTPDQTSKDALNGGYRLKGNGTRWDYLNSAGNKYGVTTTQTNNINSVESALKSNHPVVLNGKGGGPYTRSGHYVTATGMTKDGKILINDPLSKSRSGAYDPKTLQASTRKAWISNKPSVFGGSGLEEGGMGNLTKGEAVVESARKLIGLPYIYGGNYPQDGGTDCSGLIQYAYKDALGIDIPRTTFTQLDDPNLQTIDGTDLQPGDLIYPHSGHVFLYAGNNQVVEAMKTGTNISEHEYTRKGTMFRRVLTDGSSSSGKSSSNNINNTISDDSSDSSSDPFTSAFSKLSDITQSYVGTLLTGDTWDESKMKKEDTSDPLNTVTGNRSSSDMSSISGYSTGTDSITSSVMALRPTVEKYANQYGIGDKVDLLMAQIMQEAGGEPHALATDPMQSAEGHGMAAGSLNNPELSIQWGCEEFADRLNDAGGNIPLTLQSYNYGKGFVDYVNSNGGQMTQDLVNTFSDQQASKLGWSGYGDKQYVQHVLRYYNGGGSGGEIMPMPMEISNMRDMNYYSDGEFGGAGDETAQSSINTEDFIYQNFKSTNDQMNEAIVKSDLIKSNSTNAEINEIITLLKDIKQNTFDTVQSVNNVSSKIDNIEIKVQKCTTQSQNTEENNKNNEDIEKSKNAMEKLSRTKSSDRISDAYFKASGIARGRRR